MLSDKEAVAAYRRQVRAVRRQARVVADLKDQLKEAKEAHDDLVITLLGLENQEGGLFGEGEEKEGGEET